VGWSTQRIAYIEKQDGYIQFEIQANGFLRFMVRNIVGTLVQVGHGKITPDNFKTILLSKDRNNAGPTAPPHVRRNGVDVRTHYIRFHLVALSGGQSASVVDGIEE